MIWACGAHEGWEIFRGEGTTPLGTGAVGSIAGGVKYGIQKITPPIWPAMTPKTISKKNFDSKSIASKT